MDDSSDDGNSNQVPFVLEFEVSSLEMDNFFKVILWKGEANCLLLESPIFAAKVVS